MLIFNNLDKKAAAFQPKMLPQSTYLKKPPSLYFRLESNQ
jgi:hypothetical protein